MANVPGERRTLDTKIVYWIWCMGCIVRLGGLVRLLHDKGVRIVADSQERGNKLTPLNFKNIWRAQKNAYVE